MQGETALSTRFMVSMAIVLPLVVTRGTKHFHVTKNQKVISSSLATTKLPLLGPLSTALSLRLDNVGTAEIWDVRRLSDSVYTR